MNLKSSSQTITLNNKDTNICFSSLQAKFLLKKVYECDKYSSLDSVCEYQLLLYKDVQISQENAIKDLQSVISNNSKVEVIKNHDIEQLTESLQIANRNTRIQKFYKWTAIIVGGAATMGMGYLYITK